MIKSTKSFVSLFFLVSFFSLLPFASALEFSEAQPQQILLHPCQSTTFTFTASNLDNSDFSSQLSIRGLPSFLNYSLQPQLRIPAHSSSFVSLTVLYPCDASVEGLFPFSITAVQNGRTIAATSATVETATDNSISLILHQVDHSPNGGDYACACGSANFDLEIRNAGPALQEGVVMISSPFNSAISQNSFSLSSGEMETKRIVLQLPCSSPAGVYPISVLIARKGETSKPPTTFARSGVSVGQCFGSYLSGNASISACLDSGLRFNYTVVNNGEVDQNYMLNSTLGYFAPPTFSLSGYSSGHVELVVPQSPVNRAGRYPFTMQMQWADGSISNAVSIPAVLEINFCKGVTQESIDGEVANASIPFKVTPGVHNDLQFTITNFNRFPWHNAHLELSGFGNISKTFDLAAGENITLPVVLDVPSNFSTRNATLFLFTDEGNAATVIQLEASPTPLAGFFTLGGFHANDTSIIFFFIALLIVVAISYYAHIRGEEKKETDQVVAGHLHVIGGKIKAKA